MRTTVYNNTNLTSAIAVTKSIFELRPNTEGLLGITGHHPTTLNYDPSVLVHAWQLMHQAANAESSLWTSPAYDYDMVDVTRQVMANAFIPLNSNLVSTYYSPNSSSSALTHEGAKLVHLLKDLDTVLLTNPISGSRHGSTPLSPGPTATRACSCISSIMRAIRSRSGDPRAKLTITPPSHGPGWCRRTTCPAGRCSCST